MDKLYQKIKDSLVLLNGTQRNWLTDRGCGFISAPVLKWKDDWVEIGKPEIRSKLEIKGCHVWWNGEYLGMNEGEKLEVSSGVILARAEDVLGNLGEMAALVLGEEDDAD
ncbi:MAG: hypothetical protein NC114_10545 [Ruminococcus flavefaciens]|nr:hypothetical protein [Ruminococcus flavefaciens]